MSTVLENDKKANKQSHRPIFISEIVWYSIFGVIWVTGLVLAILGVCAYNVGTLANNPLYAAQKGLAAAFGGSGVADFRIVGSCFMVVAMIGFLISIYIYTNKIAEKKAADKRYQERMRILMAGDEEKAAKTETAAAPATTPTTPAKK